MKLKSATFVVIVAFMLFLLAANTEVFSFGCKENCTGNCLNCYTPGIEPEGYCVFQPDPDTDRQCVDDPIDPNCDHSYMIGCCMALPDTECKYVEKGDFIRCGGAPKK